MTATTGRYQIVHNNPESFGGLDEPYFDSLEDAQREGTRLVNSLPDAWLWIWDCEKKCKVQEFEKDWKGRRF